MSIKISVPNDKTKIQQQIKALKYQITHDTNEKDKEIHKQALKELEKVLENR